VFFIGLEGTDWTVILSYSALKRYRLTLHFKRARARPTKA